MINFTSCYVKTETIIIFNIGKWVLWWASSGKKVKMGSRLQRKFFALIEKGYVILMQESIPNWNDHIFNSKWIQLKSFRWFSYFEKKLFSTTEKLIISREISYCVLEHFLQCSATLQKESLTFLLQNVLSVWKERNE